MSAQGFPPLLQYQEASVVLATLKLALCHFGGELESVAFVQASILALQSLSGDRATIQLGL